MPTPAEIREQVTQRMIEALEAGTGTVPWARPWRVSPNSGNPTNLVSRRTYRGINIWLLNLHRLRFGFESKWFGTFDQIKSLGGVVKKRPEDVEPGQWGCPIVFFRPVSKHVADQETGENREESYRLLRTYCVFSADQCDGLDRFQVKDDNTDPNTIPDFEPADRLIEATGADIRYGGDRAFYHRPIGEFPNHSGGDYIQVPHRRQFVDLAGWTGTILHELIHWTECRTGFDKINSSYAFGELAAELGASFLSTELGVPQGGEMANHAAYVRSWLAAMKADSSYIFKASTWASKASDYLLSFVQSQQPAEAGQAV